MSAILRVDPDPRVVEVIARCPVERRADGSRWDGLPELLEALAAHGLAPIEWTEQEWSAGPVGHSVPALLIALRNPRALVTAEALLSAALEGTGGEYVGLRSWDTLCRTNYATDSGSYVPSLRHAGFESAHAEDLARWWLEATRDTGESYGYPGAIVWRCADQILAGPSWVADLYRTGLGLWCWEADWGCPQWALLARDGDGVPWPELDPEKRETPPA